jgi:hypothetical protein
MIKKKNIFHSEVVFRQMLIPRKVSIIDSMPFSDVQSRAVNGAHGLHISTGKKMPLFFGKSMN